MAKLSRVIPPPPVCNIELSEEEAIGLCRLLSIGVSVNVLKHFNLSSLEGIMRNCFRSHKSINDDSRIRPATLDDEDQ